MSKRSRPNRQRRVTRSYHDTLAMYQHHGKEWEMWNKQLKSVLPPMQSTTGPSPLGRLDEA
ncbi:MAG: hypothetical protein NTV46_15360 [Verrucomicrobia bacterium]|nr:hypothetical protein [Verrucomicrobiota bacterium]